MSEQVAFFASRDFEGFPGNMEVVCGKPSVCPICGESMWPLRVERHAVLLDRKLGRELSDGRTRCRRCGGELAVTRDVSNAMADALPLRAVR